MIRRRLGGSGRAPPVRVLGHHGRQVENLRTRTATCAATPRAPARGKRCRECDQRGRAVAGEREQWRGLFELRPVARRAELLAAELLAGVEAEASSGGRGLDDRSP